MPIPDGIARLNRYVANPLTRTFAGRIPPFAIVYHRGRKSGRIFQTPIMAYESEAGYVIALTYGPDRDWVKNVLHTGGCYLGVRGKRIRLDQPEILAGSAGMAYMPAVVRAVLKRIQVNKFLRLRANPRS